MQVHGWLSGFILFCYILSNSNTLTLKHAIMTDFVQSAGVIFPCDEKKYHDNYSLSKLLI